ncbi:MAG TPA: hypothetical protein PKE66_04440, partial [Pyrinomonadaceae bacterium]|nr:hypothetical protein [Pyrinomonadaceae bacterium]
SKLGGLTTFEALACRLPIIADATTPPMPQEAGTVDLVAKNGAGIILERSADIVPAIRSLMEDETKYRRMRDATASVSLPDSTERIIREIAALLPVAQPERAELAAA